MATKKRKALEITPNIKIVAKDLVCPITLQIFRHPVIASDGFTYEKWSLIQLLNSSNPQSPITREPLTRKYYNNQFIKQTTASFLDKNPDSKSEQFSDDLYYDYDICKSEFMICLDKNDFVAASKYKNINLSDKYYGKHKDWKCIAQYIFAKCQDVDILFTIIYNFRIEKNICNRKSIYYYIYKFCKSAEILKELLIFDIIKYKIDILTGLCKNPECIDMFFYITNKYQLDPYHSVKSNHNIMMLCIKKNPELCSKLFESLLQSPSISCHKCLYAVLEKFSVDDINRYLNKLDEHFYLATQYPDPYLTMLDTISYSAMESVGLNINLSTHEKGTIIKRIVDILYFTIQI